MLRELITLHLLVTGWGTNLTTALGNSAVSSQIQIPYLLTKEIQDLFIRKNFVNLVQYFSQQNQLVNFNFFELVITSAVSNQSMNHNLGYLPKDVVVTQITGSGTIQFLYGQFTNTQFFYTATGACRVRFFIGTYCNDTSTVSAQSTDIQSVVSTPLTATQNLPVAVTGDYQILGTEYLIRVTTAGIGSSYGANLTLPVAVKGMVVRVQKVDNNTHPVTIMMNPKNSGQISPPNATSMTLTIQWQSVEMVFDGTNWCLFSKWSGS